MQNLQDRVTEIALDQRRRWKNGDRVGLEAILDATDPIWQEAESLTDLVTNEFRLQIEHGIVPAVEEFLERFPSIRDKLKRHFEWVDAVYGSFFAEPIEPDSDTVASLLDELLAGQSIAGKRFGPFDIEERIGKGGFGEVYRGRHAVLGHYVALKFAAANQFGSPEHRRRSIHEARIAAQFRHDHIVRLYDIIERGHLLVLVYEYIPGRTLADWLKDNRPANATTAVRILHPIVEAVHFAHLNGVFHRDIKPGNILLNSEQAAGDLPFRPMLSDFGLAIPAPRPNAESSESIHVSGSLLYMPPEQALGERPKSPVGDIYSLGAVLYELLTGRTVFEGSPWEVFRQLQSESPKSTHEGNSEIPKELDAICCKCLSRDPTDRYQAADELAGELRAFLLGDQPITSIPPRDETAGWLRRHRATACLVAGVLFAALFGIFAAASAPPPGGAEPKKPAAPATKSDGKLIRIGTVKLSNRAMVSVAFIGEGRWLIGSDDGRILQFETFDKQLDPITFSPPQVTYGIAYDPLENVIYTTNGPRTQVDIRNPDGQRIRAFYTSEALGVGGLSFARKSETIWIITTHRTVQQFDIDGKVLRTLTVPFQASGIAIDEELATLYLTKWDPVDDDHVYRLRLDAKPERWQHLMRDEVEGNLNGLEFHPASRVLYLTSEKNGSLVLFADVPDFSHLHSIDDPQLGIPTRHTQNIQQLGNSALTRDESTGLEWLDLRYTKGLSAEQIAQDLQPGGRFQGFRYATFDEVKTLFRHAGLKSIGFRDSKRQFSTLVELQKLIGLTDLQSSEFWESTAICKDGGIHTGQRKATRQVCDFRTRTASWVDLDVDPNVFDGKTAHWLVRQLPVNSPPSDFSTTEDDFSWRLCWIVAAVGSLLGGILGALFVHVLHRRNTRKASPTINSN